jgi:hypothetical protein
MNLALEKELNKDYLTAVQLYKNQISGSSVTAQEDYINLAFLYWLFAADYGFAEYYSIPQELRDKGGEEYSKILDLAIAKYPNSVELKFWARYFPHRHYFVEFPRHECERMITESTEEESLIPYFYLYLFDKKRYKKQKERLLELCKATPSAKFTYIKSIIGG